MSPYFLKGVLCQYMINLGYQKDGKEKFAKVYLKKCVLSDPAKQKEILKLALQSLEQTNPSGGPQSERAVKESSDGENLLRNTKLIEQMVSEENRLGRKLNAAGQYHELEKVRNETVDGRYTVQDLWSAAQYGSFELALKGSWPKETATGLPFPDQSQVNKGVSIMKKFIDDHRSLLDY